MKKLFAILSVIVLAGCTTSEYIPTKPTEAIQMNENELINVMIKTNTFQATEGYTKLLTSEIDTIILGEEVKEKYPQLSKSIEEENEIRKNYVEGDFDEEIQMAKERYLEYDTAFANHEINLIAYIKRSDENVLSVSYCCDMYTGGIHPNQYYSAVNFDTESGKKLALSDVFKDTDLAEIIKNELVEKYGEESRTFDLDDEVFSELNEANTDRWTIGYDRVTFYFSPYEIASYAAGLVTAELFFDEYGDIINEKYISAPDSYAVEITDGWKGYVCDINPMDEKKDIINISAEYQNDMYSRLILTLNGNGYGHNVWFYSSKAFFVHTGNKNYIYVETTSENDYKTILVFNAGERISFAGELVGTGFAADYIDGVYTYHLLTNPESFKLGTRMDMLSTYSGVKEYYVDKESGLPCSKMEYYDINVDYHLTNIVPVTAFVLPEKAEEEIAVGESFTFLRTDNETYVDMKLSDEREVRIMVEMIDGYMAGIKGELPWDVFDGVMLAG